MQNKFEKNIKVLPSVCDSCGKMSYASFFALYMDLASEHAPLINLGMDTLSKKGLFWLTCKTRVKFFARPQMLDEITALTWPELPSKIRCNRFYEVSKNSEVLSQGKTEWAIIETNTNRLTKISDVYPENLIHYERSVCEQPFSKMNEDYSTY